MNDEIKVVSGIAIKMLYSPEVLTKMQELIRSSPGPTNVMAKIIATVFQQAVAKAQQAGVELTNDVATKSLIILIKEVTELLAKEGGIEPEQAKQLGQVLFATSLKALKEITSMPQPSAAQPGQQGQMPPAQGQVPAPAASQGGGMIQQQMGAM